MQYAPTIFLWCRNKWILTSWFAQLFHYQRWVRKWWTFICRVSMVLSQLGTMVWKPGKIHLQTVKCGLFIAQNGYRNRDNEIVTCANPHRNRDNEIVTCANPHRNRDNEIVTPTLRHQQSRWGFAHQGKPFTSLAMKALQAKQRVRSNCEVTLRARYMTKIHARYIHKQTCKGNYECDNKQRMDRQTLSDESDRISYQPKRRKDRSQKYSLLAHNNPITRLGLKEMRLVFLTNRDIYHVHTNTRIFIIR